MQQKRYKRENETTFRVRTCPPLGHGRYHIHPATATSSQIRSAPSRVLHEPAIVWDSTKFSENVSASRKELSNGVKVDAWLSMRGEIVQITA